MKPMTAPMRLAAVAVAVVALAWSVALLPSLLVGLAGAWWVVS